EFLRKIADKLGEKDIDDINFVKISKYKNAKLPGEKKKEYTRTELAVIYANGEITSGESDETWIGSKTFVENIREVRMDDDVKAVVLRINSPGGSALASETIWRELTLLADQKPLVVSMGNVAASGGYYIATPGKKIFASANTVTGSIGVFGILPNFKELANDKMGITFDGVKTNKFADMGDLSRPLTDEEYSIIQKQVENIYETFVKRVAEGRNLRPEYVDSIGQGRVWSGLDALELGLVDEIGDLEEAIEEAVKLAELTDYRIKGYPKIKDPIQKILDELNLENMAKTYLSSYVSKDAQLQKSLEHLEAVRRMKGVQMRMPFLVD
ncbi:MAG: signal peptide peptidase SppA, partial [Luteibaculum sp.]